MPKLLEVAQLLNETINNNELSAALSSSDPASVDISEEAFEEIKNQASGLMTLDRALNDDRVVKPLKDRFHREEKALIYDKAEESLKPVLQKFNIDPAGKKFVDQLNELQQVDTSSKTDDSVYKNEINQLHERLKAAEAEKEEIKTSYESNLQDFKKNTIIDDMLNSYKLAEPYQDELVKKGIFSTVKSELERKAVIKLGEGNTLGLYKKEDPNLEYYDGNKKAGVKDLLDPLLQPYVKKSDGKPTETKRFDVKSIDINQNSQVGMLKSSAKRV